jgi:hypothetical protein
MRFIVAPRLVGGWNHRRAAFDLTPMAVPLVPKENLYISRIV